MDLVTRTIKIELSMPNAQRRVADIALYNSRRVYNLLVEHLHCIRNTGKRRLKLIKDLYLVNPLLAYKLEVLEFWKYWQDDYLNIRRKGWATEFVRAVENQNACVWPRQDEDVKIKGGKHKGEAKLVPIVRNKDGGKSAKPGASGLPGQSLGLVCQQFEANIKSFYTHKKNGNKGAELPKRFKGQYPLIFSNQLIKYLGNAVYQFGAKPTIIKLRLPELSRFEKINDAKLSKSRSGKYYLCVSGKLAVETNENLTNTAAIDFGQKRAIVIATRVDGKVETASISGKNILALKRERDYRNREVNRLRAQVFKGQFRQYLTDAEKTTFRELEKKDDRRQAQGKSRKGDAIKYAWRIIRKRRKEAGLKKFSRRDFKLKRTLSTIREYYRVRLTYANHCVSKAAVDWAADRGVGKIYVGDLDSLPKGRKTGNRRVKQVSRNNRWEMPTQRKYLEEKLVLAGSPSDEPVEKHSEAYTSQTCPNCGRLHKPRGRVYHCNKAKGGCGWRGDRDGVGAANFLSLVETGSCGNLMPEPLRTLPISPAIGQRLPMRGPGGKTACEPAEELVPKGQSNLQAPAIVGADSLDGLAETPVFTRKTQARRGNKALANRESLAPTEDLKPVSSSQTAKTGGLKAKTERCLQNSSESLKQLTIWDTT